MALPTFLLRLLITFGTLVCGKGLLVSLEKKSDFWVPLSNGTYTYDADLAIELAYDPKARLIYTTGEEYLVAVGVNRRLGMQMTGVLNTGILPKTVAACGRHAIVAGEREGSMDGSLIIYERTGGVALGRPRFRRRLSLSVTNGPFKVSTTSDCRQILVSSAGVMDETTVAEGFLTLITFTFPNFYGRYTTTKLSFSEFETSGDRDLNAHFHNAASLECSIPDSLQYTSIYFDTGFARPFNRISRNGWWSLRNNAVAVVDVFARRIVDVIPLGYKDFNLTINPFDPSDKDDGVHLNTWPVSALYQPEGITTMCVGKETFLLTGNKGVNSRMKVRDATLDPTIFPNAEFLKQNEKLGRLLVNTFNADTDNDGDLDVLQATGSRSISLWSSDGSEVIADTENMLEFQISSIYLERFNADDVADQTINESFDQQSRKKGPEPGALKSIPICNGHYELVIVACQRPGYLVAFTLDTSNLSAGFMFQDIWTDELSSEDLDKTWSALYDERKVTIVDPRSIVVVPGKYSPNFKPLVMVASNDSGVLSIFQINVQSC